MAWVLRGIGAYWGLISIVARVRSPCSRVLRTRPTDTPEMRTSAVSDNCVASAKSIWTSYPLARSGTGPPNVLQRYSRIAKQDDANRIIIASCDFLRARLFIVLP